MSDTTLDGTCVTICDWHGRIVWMSGKYALSKAGDFAWKHLSKPDQERSKSAISRVATLGEEQVLDVENCEGIHFRAWMWPLQSPDVAVCILSIVTPRAMQTLSKRELETLSLLAQGYSSKEIAAKLEVSISTVHTHLKRSREKTGARNLESLGAFAARYCHPNQGVPAPQRK